MTRVRIHSPDLPNGLQGWLLVDEFGVPRFWPAVWQILRGPKLAESTLGLNLSSIERLYAHAVEVSGVNLDRAIADLDLDAIETVMGGFFLVLANHHAATSEDISQSWAGALGYVKFLTRLLAPGRPGLLAEIERNLLEQDVLLSSLVPSRGKAKAGRLRALPASVVSELLEVSSPDHSQNPFRDEASRWRNYVLVLLLLFSGLRRGEALSLKPGSICDGINPENGQAWVWLNILASDGADDPRYERPGIKTVLSNRQVPLDAAVATVIGHYVDEHRARQPHAFLLSSNRDRPMSSRLVAYVFRELSACLSESARKELLDRCGDDKVTAHDLRHTCAVSRLGLLREEGVGNEEALQLLRSFFGWSKGSLMPNHYAEAHFEDRLKTVFSSKLDSRVAFLRQLRRLDENGGLLSIAPGKGDPT